MEIFATVDVECAEPLEQHIPAQPRLGFIHPDREMGPAGYKTLPRGYDVDTWNTRKLRHVNFRKHAAPVNLVGNCIECDQAEGGVEFAHLHIEAGECDLVLIDDAEIFSSYRSTACRPLCVCVCVKTPPLPTVENSLEA